MEESWNERVNRGSNYAQLQLTFNTAHTEASSWRAPVAEVQPSPPRTVSTMDRIRRPPVPLPPGPENIPPFPPQTYAIAPHSSIPKWVQRLRRLSETIHSFDTNSAEAETILELIVRWAGPRDDCTFQGPHNDTTNFLSTWWENSFESWSPFWARASLVTTNTEELFSRLQVQGAVAHGLRPLLRSTNSRPVRQLAATPQSLPPLPEDHSLECPQRRHHKFQCLPWMARIRYQWTPRPRAGAKW